MLKIACVLKTVIAHNMDTCKTWYTHTFELEVLKYIFLHLRISSEQQNIRIHWHTREETEFYSDNSEVVLVV